MYSHFRMHKPGSTAQLTLANIPAYALKKQSKTVLNTNGSAASRELYTDPVSLNLFFQDPEDGSASSGKKMAVAVIEYVVRFSGFKGK